MKLKYVALVAFAVLFSLQVTSAEASFWSGINKWNHCDPAACAIAHSPIHIVTVSHKNVPVVHTSVANPAGAINHFMQVCTKSCGGKSCDKAGIEKLIGSAPTPGGNIAISTEQICTAAR